MTPDETDAWDRLAFHLENQIGFWFALVDGDDPRPRATLREETRRWCGEHGMTFHLHAPPPQLLAGLAVELARGAPPGMHWIRADGPDGLIEQWDAATAQLVLAMNERREAYRKRLDGGILLEGRDSLKRLLRELAPDMFSIRAFIAEPGTAGSTPLLTGPVWREPVHSVIAWTGPIVDPDQALQHATRLTATEGSPASPSWAQAMLMAAAELARAGQTEEAERCADALVVELDRNAGDTPGKLLDPLHSAALTGLRGMLAWSRDKHIAALPLLDQSIGFLWGHLAQTKGIEAGRTFLLLRDQLGVRGQMLLTQGNAAGAEDSFKRRINLLELGDPRSPLHQEVQIELLQARRLLARAIAAKGDPTVAEGALRDDLGRLEREVEQHPTEARWRLELLEYRRDLGRLLFERGDLDGARETYSAALSTARTLFEHEPDERWSNILDELHTGLCVIAGALQEWTAALAWADQCLAFAIRRRAQQPLDRGLGWRVASWHAQRAQILLHQDDHPEALVALLNAWFELRYIPLQKDYIDVVGLLAQLHLHVGLGLMSARIEAPPTLRKRRGSREGSAEWIARFRHCAGYFKRAIRLGERVLAVTSGDLDTRRVVELACSMFCSILAFLGDRRNARRMRCKRRALHRHRRARKPSPG